MEINTNNSFVNPSVRYAGFWIRVVASIIDSIITGIPIYIVQLIFGQGFIYFALSVIITVGYFAYMESSDKQATVGKIVVGIKVTDLNGDRIDLTKAIIRSVSKYLSALILCIGYIMVAFTAKKQGLHDMIAGTLVVYKS